MVAEVKSAFGCAVGHKVGDRILFGADGSLLCRESPDRVCAGLLSPLGPYVMLMLDKPSINDVIAFPFSEEFRDNL